MHFILKYMQNIISISMSKANRKLAKQKEWPTSAHVRKYLKILFTIIRFLGKYDIGHQNLGCLLFYDNRVVYMRKYKRTVELHCA